MTLHRALSAVALTICATQLQAALPRLDLAVILDPAARILDVTATLSADAGADSIRWALTPNAGLPADTLTLPPSAHRRSAVVRYTLLLDSLTASSHRETLGDTAAKADEHGSFLPASSQWHPAPLSGNFHYSVSLDLPASQRGLVAGRIESEQITAGRYRARFTFDAPAQGFDLMAGPYLIDERVVELARPVRVRTYFHPQLQSLAGDYLDASARYLERFSARYGPYPYTEFSIVSSPTPTGFGMPTLTYLGIDVLKLPFIRHPSLGHEVLHNWWGNGVFVDYSGGNWCEGLTTYLADYAFKEQESAQAAHLMRLAWLRDLSALTGGEIPRTFVARTHGSSQIVGYHKTAMLFHQLRQKLGEANFDASVRDLFHHFLHREASWRDLQTLFEARAGESLETLFAQVLDRADLPRPRLVDAVITGPEQLSVTLEQGTPPFDLQVPVAIETSSGTRVEVLHLHTTRQQFLLTSPERSMSVRLDPDHQILRHLDAAELPAILRQVMVAPRVRLAVADEDTAFITQARGLAAQLLDQPMVTEDASAQLLIGTHAAVERALGQPAPPHLRDRGTALAWAERTTNGGVRLIVSVRDLAALRALSRPLPHYGGQSYVVFDGSKAIERGVWPALSPGLQVR